MFRARPAAAAEPFLPTVPEVFRDFGYAVPSRLESRWTPVEGRLLHSRGRALEGGIPFVLVHGLVISSLYFVPLAECLAVEHAVYAVDLPGFGRSPGPRAALDIAQLAEALGQWLSVSGISQCHLVANSLGCQVAAHLAAWDPTRIKTLTLIGATIDPAAPRLLPQFLRLVRDAVHEPPRLWVNWAVDFFRAGFPRAYATTRAMLADRIAEQLVRIPTPTLVLRGALDPAMPQAWAEALTQFLPDGLLRVLPGHAHCVHYSSPREVAALILAHATSEPGQSSRTQNGSDPDPAKEPSDLD